MNKKLCFKLFQKPPGVAHPTPETSKFGIPTKPKVGFLCSGLSWKTKSLLYFCRAPKYNDTFFNIILRGYFNPLLPFNGSQTQNKQREHWERKRKTIFLQTYISLTTPLVANLGFNVAPPGEGKWLLAKLETKAAALPTSPPSPCFQQHGAACAKIFVICPRLFLSLFFRSAIAGPIRD